MANKQIAAAVHLAPSTCHERIRSLKASGAIAGAHAEIDRKAIGVGLEALVYIKLAKYEREVIERFMSDMEAIPEVRSAFLVNGRHDVVLHLAVRDIEHLRNLGLDRITSQPVVVNIETSIVYEGRSKQELPILAKPSDDKQDGRAKSKKRQPARRPKSRS